MVDFIDRVTGKIDKSVKTISSKGKEFLETKKLKSEIEDVEKTTQDKFQALGKKVFWMVNKDALNIDELKTDCGGIAALFKKITELEDTIKKVELEALKVRYGEDAIMCARCEAPNKLGYKFCGSCGSDMAEAAAQRKTCSTCGTSLKEDDKFCIKCGGKAE